MNRSCHRLDTSRRQLATEYPRTCAGIIHYALSTNPPTQFAFAWTPGYWFTLRRGQALGANWRVPRQRAGPNHLCQHRAVACCPRRCRLYAHTRSIGRTSEGVMLSRGTRDSRFTPVRVLDHNDSMLFRSDLRRATLAKARLTRRSPRRQMLGQDRAVLVNRKGRSR